MTPTALQESVITIGVDVDTQIAFAEGNLRVPMSPAIRENIGKISRALRMKIGSVDSHAFDAWEFKENGGPFPSHAVKGTPDWLKIPETQTARTRFVPMSNGNLVTGETHQGEGVRRYDRQEFTNEVRAGVTTLFEKEVYSLFSNPNAEPFIEALVQQIEQELHITRDQILFAVYGFCTGKYCVDDAALGLKSRGYRTAIVEDATAPLNINSKGEPQDGKEVTRQLAKDNGIEILQTSDLLTA